jgi:tripartite-type tricarboxylate transporter receptor subunit TctC
MVVTAKKDYAGRGRQGAVRQAQGDGPKTTAAHAGVGSNSHLCNLLLQQTLEVKFTEAAYRGTGPAMNDLVAGQVDLLCDQSTTAVPQIQGNSIKAFAGDLEGKRSASSRMSRRSPNPAWRTSSS